MSGDRLKMGNLTHEQLGVPKLPKRFYKQASHAQTDGGWEVLLDARQLKTPAKAALLLPSEKLAIAIAAEWNAQGEEIDPQKMPQMQFSCATLDYTRPFRGEVEEELAAYASTDLLCYRADETNPLTARQAELWDPHLEWARQHYGINPTLATGIMPIKQEPQMMARLAEAVSGYDEYRLTALWLITKHCASLMLALAVLEGQLRAQDAFALSRLEETFQNEQWGEDSEAKERRELAALEMAELDKFLQQISE